ncbi:MAG: hypothetical protein JNN11_05320 [Candidatus Doudnabacteria bacterium]|nr:hypothetical protein [Candidatus Doudnabacteria bacterium]
MSDFYKQDIFFVLASVLVVSVTLLALIVGYYIVRIVKAINYISQKAKAESDLLAEDLSDLRENVKGQSFKFKHFASFFNSVYKRHKK